MNPILQGVQNPQLAQVRQMVNLMQGAKNPQAFITQMANTNPELQNVMRMVQNNGGDARSLFYQMARERGVDPEYILNQLK